MEGCVSGTQAQEDVCGNASWSELIGEAVVHSPAHLLPIEHTMTPTIHFSPPVPKRVIALVGGIAAGKSTARKLLSEKIIPEYFQQYKASLSHQHSESQATTHTFIDADVIGHSIYLKGKPAYHQILTTWKNHDLCHPETEEINRKILGGIVFSDENEMKKLQDIVWPRIEEEMLQKLKEVEQGYVILEAAVLLEANWHHIADEIWCFSADREIVIQRLKGRNHLTKEEAEKRLAAQWTNEERERHADVVIRTNISQSQLPQRLSQVFLNRFRHVNLPKYGIIILPLDSSEDTVQRNLELLRGAVDHIGQSVSVFLVKEKSGSMPSSHSELKALSKRYRDHAEECFKSHYCDVLDVVEKTSPKDFNPEGRIYIASELEDSLKDDNKVTEPQQLDIEQQIGSMMCDYLEQHRRELFTEIEHGQTSVQTPHGHERLVFIPSCLMEKRERIEKVIHHQDVEDEVFEGDTKFSYKFVPLEEAAEEGI